MIVGESGEDILIHLDLLLMQLRFFAETGDEVAPEASSEVLDAVLTKSAGFFGKNGGRDVADLGDVFLASLICGGENEAVRDRILNFDEVDPAGLQCGHIGSRFCFARDRNKDGHWKG